MDCQTDMKKYMAYNCNYDILWFHNGIGTPRWIRTQNQYDCLLVAAHVSREHYNIV